MFSLEDLQKPLDYGFHNLTMKEYKKIPALNSSSLKEGRVSPEHLDLALSDSLPKPEKEKTHNILGNAFHTWILEPELFDQRYLPFCQHELPYPEKDFRNPENKKYKQDLEKQALEENKQLLTLEQFQELEKMKVGLFKKKSVRQLFEASGKVEHTMIWRHNEFNINCKGRIDKLIKGNTIYILDLKSTKEPSEREFNYAWRNYNYNFQAAFYEEGYRILTGETSLFIFIFQEKTYPYLTFERVISEEKLKEARKELYKIIEKYIKYKNNDIEEGIEVF